MKGRVGKGRRQPDHMFIWERGQGISGWDAECILKRYGVPVIGREYAARSPTVGVRVPGSQAVFAEYLLCRTGLALSTPLLNPAHGKMKPTALPPAWGKPAKTRGAMGWFVRILATMFVGGDTAKDLPTASTKRKR